VAGRFVTRWIGKRRTVYGITLDRVLVRSGSTVRDSPVTGGSMLAAVNQARTVLSAGHAFGDRARG